MTYTIKQRRKIYETALNYFLLLREQNTDGAFMCCVIRDITDHWTILDIHFPELFAQRPSALTNSSPDYAWYNSSKGRNKLRIQALERAIELTYKK